MSEFLAFPSPQSLFPEIHASACCWSLCFSTFLDYCLWTSLLSGLYFEDSLCINTHVPSINTHVPSTFSWLLLRETPVVGDSLGKDPKVAGRQIGQPPLLGARLQEEVKSLLDLCLVVYDQTCLETAVGVLEEEGMLGRSRL